MKVLMGFAAEIWGLFVDDAGFSIEIIIALVAAELAGRLGLPAAWRGLLLFLLAALVLAQSAWRCARGSGLN